MPSHYKGKDQDVARLKDLGGGEGSGNRRVGEWVNWSVEGGEVHDIPFHSFIASRRVCRLFITHHSLLPPSLAKDFQEYPVQLVKKLSAQAAVIHFVAEELSPQPVDGDVHVPQLGQVSGLRGEFFFQEKAFGMVAERDNILFDLLSRCMPGIISRGIFFRLT